MNHLLSHVPLDRLQALSAGHDLPLHSAGAVLFADISGFTPLTEHLMRTLGSRRGAEALTHMLDQVYDPLITRVHAYGGSVIGFSGDAITCWFPAADPRPALACGLAMQAAMADLAAHQPRDLPAPLSLKVCVAHGPVQRMVVGDPAIQLIDVLEGPPLNSLGAIDHLARPGDVLVAEDLAMALDAHLILAGWRTDADSGVRAALLHALTPPLPHPADPDSDLPLQIEQLRAWVAPAVLSRLEDDNAPFLTELRPVVALFLRFGTGDDRIDLAAVRDYIRAVQAVLARYNATLIQVTLGEKGSYLYAAFGAPIAHEDDAVRAIQAARELRQMPMDARSGVQIGVAQGVARTGLYGGRTRRTYGVLGDAVNLAARLMQHAAPGQILANDLVWTATGGQLGWQPLPPLKVKGKPAPLRIASLADDAPAHHRASPARQGPVVGRDSELAALGALLARATPAGGQVIAVTGAPGIGKSRLVGALLDDLPASWQVVQSATQSYGVASPYLAWIPVWQRIFAVDPAADLAANLAHVQKTLAHLAPASLSQLPLLGAVLGLPIPENDLTRALDARLRKTWLETMLIQVLRAYLAEQAAHGRRLLLVLEDLHWLDQLSADLLAQVITGLDTLPLTLVLTARPGMAASPALDDLLATPKIHAIQLGELEPEAITQLLAAKLASQGAALDPAALDRLSAQIAQQAAGNPFYAEELITYLSGAGLALDARRGWQDLELPVGLHRLVLSRVDRLDAQAQRVLKTASILGATFRRDWLAAFYPALGGTAAVDAALAILEAAELLAPSADPALARFTHAITREVTYESLAQASRGQLHEQCAAQLEQAADAAEHLDLLAYHYGRSPNDPKAITALARSAARAASLFANADAVHQYQAALERAARPGVESPLPLAELAGGLGDVYSQMAAFDAALAQYEQARAALADADLAQAAIDLRRADVLVRATRFDEAMAVIAQTEAHLAPYAASPPARVILAQLANLRSIKDFRQGAMQQALEWAERGLRHIDAIPNTYPQVATTRIRLYQSLVAAAAMLRDYARAQKVLNTALRLIKRYPHPVVEGELQFRKAVLSMNRGRLTLAIQQFRQALRLIEATGTRDRVAALLINGGQTLVLRGQLQEAQEWLERGVALGEEIGSAFQISACLQLLGWMHNSLGNWETALGYLRRGKQLAVQHEMRDRLVSFILFEAMIAVYQGNYDQSEVLFAEAMDLAQRYELPNQIVECHYHMAYSALMQGNLALAQSYRQEQMFKEESVQSYTDAAHLLSNVEWWAMVAAETEPISGMEAKTIASAVRNALQFLRQRAFLHTLPFAYRVNAMFAYLTGNLDEAWDSANQGIRMARRVGREPELARNLLWRGKIELYRSANLESLRDIRQAVRIFAQLGAWPEFTEARAFLVSIEQSNSQSHSKVTSG